MTSFFFIFKQQTKLLSAQGPNKGGNWDDKQIAHQILS